MNWKPYANLLPMEYQGIAPFCVAYAACNVYEIMAIQRNIEINLSDRHLAVLSNTTQEGNHPDNVLNTFQHLGVVTEKDCPFPWWQRWFYKLPWVWNQINDIFSVDLNARYYKIKGWSRIATDPASLQAGLEESPLLLLIPSPYTSGNNHAVVGLNVLGSVIQVLDSVVLKFFTVDTLSIISAHTIRW